MDTQTAAQEAQNHAAEAKRQAARAQRADRANDPERALAAAQAALLAAQAASAAHSARSHRPRSTQKAAPVWCFRPTAPRTWRSLPLGPRLAAATRPLVPRAGPLVGPWGCRPSTHATSRRVFVRYRPRYPLACSVCSLARPSSRRKTPRSLLACQRFERVFGDKDHTTRRRRHAETREHPGASGR